MNYKVKIEDRTLSINLMHHSTVDLGIFAVKATSHSFLFDRMDGTKGADINETELEFYVNDKRCRYVGFKELYTQLYGNSFNTWEVELTRKIEEVVAKRIAKEYPGCDVNF